MRNEDAFYCRFFHDLAGYRDDSGSPLHEVDFREEMSDTTFAKCRFDDDRRGFLINVAALRQISKNWSTILAGIDYFRERFVETHEPASDLRNAWGTSLFIMFSPLFLLKRRNNPISNGRIPISVSGLFKIMLDVPTTLDLMFIEGLDNSSTGQGGPSIAADVMKYALDKKILINGQYACAGPANLIESSINLLAQPRDTAGAGSLDYWRVTIGETIQFTEFCNRMTLLYCLSVISQMLALLTLTRIPSPARPHDEALRDIPSAYDRRAGIARQALMPSAPDVLRRYSAAAAGALGAGGRQLERGLLSDFSRHAVDASLLISSETPDGACLAFRSFVQLADSVITETQASINRLEFMCDDTVDVRPISQLIDGRLSASCCQ